MTRRRGGLAGFALLLALTPALGAQETRCDPGDTEVRRLAFAGNSAFNDATLAVGIVTTPSTWMRRSLRVFGGKRCLDRTEFPVDVARLRLWYRNHGFLDATVDTVVTVLHPRVIAVRFQIFEGEPVLIDSLVVTGLEAVPERAQILNGLPSRVGGRFDRYAMSATRDTIARRLRDNGYPDAAAFRAYDLRGEARRATMRFSVEPGPRRHIGAVVITRRGRDGHEPEVTESAVQRLAGLEVGALYRERLLERAKRTLYQSEAFAQVDVTPVTVPGDSALTVSVDLTEGYLRSARLGGGWGTLDCFRATGEYTNHNLLRNATRLELRGRLSRIGVGQPLDGTEALCTKHVVRDTLFSKSVNYYGSATFSRASLVRASFVPTLTLYSELRSEFSAYLRRTPIGASIGLSRSLPRRTLSFGYSVEYGSTDAQAALFCAVFNACVLEDREALKASRFLAVLSTSSSYERTDNPLDPSRGVVGRAEVRYASRFVGADPKLEFSRFNLDGSSYIPLGQAVVLATRLRFGAVLGPTFSFTETDRFVPAQERLFAGGGTTVRGFRQNELGPAVYIPGAYDTVFVTGSRPGIDVGDTVYFQALDTAGQRLVPTGGNALVVANVELRFASPFLSDLLRWTVFADVGEVWNRGADARLLRFRNLKVTPGIGVRLRTPIGYLRADVAYNNYPRTTGAAYFDTPLTTGGGGELYCVSPANTLRIAQNAGGTLVQEVGACPGTYLPRPLGGGFLRRLTPTIAIGHAF